MKKTFANLEALCATKNVVCERRGRKIELTTPNGGTTAECETVAEALDTMAGDPTFATLPLVPTSSEFYSYELVDRDRVIHTAIAETLDGALEKFREKSGCSELEVKQEFLQMAVVHHKRAGFYGVRWTPLNPNPPTVRSVAKKAREFADYVFGNCTGGDQKYLREAAQDFAVIERSAK